LTDSLTGILEELIQGVQLIGNAITSLICLALSSINIVVPEIAIRISAIILVILTIWKLGSAVSKLFLYAMIFLLITFFAGLVPAIGQYLQVLKPS